MPYLTKKLCVIFVVFCYSIYLMDDPYEILQLSQNASDDEIKRAYYYIAKLYSPEQGGNRDEFAKFQNAYRQIMSQRQSRSVQVQEQGPRQFDVDNFNRQFRNQPQQSENDGYVYNIDDTNYQERTLARYREQYSRTSAEAEAITPMFARKGFNNNVFNQVFTQMKKKHGGDDYHEGLPTPVAGTSIIPYSNVNQLRETSNLTSLGYSDYGVYDRSHRNPNKYSGKMLQKLARNKDVTKEERLPQQEARKRMANYQQSVNLVHNNVPLNTSQDYYMNDGLGGGSGMGDIVLEPQQDMHAKLLELRKQPSQLQDQRQRPITMPINYPVNSNGHDKRELPAQIRSTFIPIDFNPPEPQAPQLQQYSQQQGPLMHYHQLQPPQLQQPQQQLQPQPQPQRPPLPYPRMELNRQMLLQNQQTQQARLMRQTIRKQRRMIHKLKSQSK